MVVNRLQNGLINSCVDPRASMVNCPNIFFKCVYVHSFFSNSDIYFYSENNNVSQVYTYITKIQKKILENVYALYFGLNFAQSLCYYLSFVFPANLIWLLHCNAMHFDSFLLGARHLFQKLVLFFYARLYTRDTLLFSE
jgi:hypothetical protein